MDNNTYADNLSDLAQKLLKDGMPEAAMTLFMLAGAILSNDLLFYLERFKELGETMQKRCIQKQAEITTSLN